MAKVESEGDDKKGAAAAPLPLGWTKVRRKNKRTAMSDDDTNNNAANEIDWCCDDPKCKKIRNNPAESKTPINATTIKGTAIFFLDETDPEWFQGYLQIEGQRKPWGLLAIQETIDECLECKDGGYRQVTLKVFSYSPSKQPHIVEHVEWTGGDMMRLQCPEVSMETDRLWTGKMAVPYVDKYFRSLVDKVRENDEQEVLDILPDLAIVTGTMTLKLTMPETTDESSKSTNSNSKKV